MKNGFKTLTWLVFMRCLAVLAAAPAPVEQLKMATFSRVPGLAGQGACIATGKAGSWNEQFVGTPTVVFDEGMYWMWYSGGQMTTDTQDLYKLIQQVGEATSRDGVHWTPLNFLSAVRCLSK